MATRTRLQRISEQMGSDLRLIYAQSGGFFEDADLEAARTPGSGFDIDLLRVEGVAALTQAIANRLKTRYGELTALGHPEYGSRHHELIGEPNVQRTRDLIKLYVLRALREEPRIRRVVKVLVTPEHSPPRDTVRIDLTVELIASAEPLNLVVPFSLGLTP